MTGYTEKPTVHVTFDDSEASVLLTVIGWRKDAAEKRGEDPGAVTAAGVLRKLVGAEFLALRRAATPIPSTDAQHAAEVELYGHELPVDAPDPPATPGAGWGRVAKARTRQQKP